MSDRQIQWGLEKLTGVDTTPINRFEVPEEVGFIITCPSGTAWTNQTGGVSCHHPVVEGVYVPADVLPSRPWASSVEKLNGDLITDVNGLRTADADAVDAYLGRNHLPFVVDRSRLRDSEEAWVWVISKEDKDTHGFGEELAAGQTAVMTWPNSD